MMVADMTTFMARLVSKLTQTAVNQTNNIIKKTEQANKSGHIFTKIEPVKLNDSDLIEFSSNLQLLDDEDLSIPGVVQQVQNLAKKNVECLTLMHSFALNQLENTHQLLLAK